MLQAIRDRATGWIAWAIVILITIPFAFWGIQEYLSPDPNVAVAEVNGEEIGYDRFQQAYARQQQRLRALLGAAYTSDLLDEEMLRRQTLETLIRDEVLVQSALTDGMRIGDAQLAGAIQGQPEFVVDGRFSQLRYEGWLRSQGYSPGGFEFDLRRSMLTEQVSAGIAGSEFATAAEVAGLARLQGQKRVLSTLTLEASEYAPGSLDEADALRFFEDNRDAFVAPEQIDVEYVLLARADVIADIQVSEEDLRALYDARKDTLGTPEQREASHVLLTLGADADDAAVAEVREKLAELRARIVAGEAFEDIAREHSEDPGSAADGGSLGGFSRGVMDPVFEEAAFGLEVGAISEPVRTPFGFHLIKLTAVTPGGAKPFDEVREQLRLEYQTEQAEQLFFERVERLANLAFENPDSLEPAADALEVEIQRTGLGSRDGDAELLTHDGVWQAALVPEVLEEGVNSELVEIDSDRVAIIRVVEYVPESPKPFDEVREEVEAALAGQQAAKAARAAGEALLERLRSGEEAEAIAAGLDAQWMPAGAVDRFSFEPASEVVETAFSAARPAEGHPSFTGVGLSSGNYVLVAVEAVEELDGESLGADRRSAADATLAADLGQRSLQAVVATMSDDADVVMHSGQIGDQTY